MARRKDKEKITDPHERARLKKLRSAQRREERKQRKQQAAASGEDVSPRKREVAADYSKPMVKDEYEWIRNSGAKAYAIKILNDHHRERPFWLSIPTMTNPPVAGFFPCTTFTARGRVYYGFLFREHRDLFFARLDDARKELTDKVATINAKLS